MPARDEVPIALRLLVPGFRDIPVAAVCEAVDRFRRSDPPQPMTEADEQAWWLRYVQLRDQSDPRTDPLDLLVVALIETIAGTTLVNAPPVQVLSEPPWDELEVEALATTA
jgi:hypothetical protein